MAPENFRLEINSPKCVSCAAAIEKQISTLSGISRVVVRPPPIGASGKYEAGFLTVNSLIGTLKAPGYNLTSARIQFKIPMRPLLPAMVWAAKVEILPGQVAGVLGASMAFAASQIAIHQRIRKALMSW